MNLFYQPEISAGQLWLSPEESRHAVRVLRMHEGDPILLTDGKGIFYDARITNANPQRCEFQIVSTRPDKQRPFQLHLAIAPTKNIDRMEWFVEKAVEIGIDRITFMLCDTSERRVIKLERLEKVAVSAMKQSGHAQVPVLSGMVPFHEILSQASGQKFLAFVDSDNSHHLKSLLLPGKDALILIGPEGDFSQNELNQALQNGFQKVSLGDHRLRTETAGLAACLIMDLINS